MPQHTRLDLTRWLDEFSLARLRADASAFVHERRRVLPDQYPNEAAVERHVQIMSPHGEIVVGPHALTALDDPFPTVSGFAD